MFFAALGFDNRGILYGLTGDGGNPPESVFIINPDDATSTFFMTLGNGDDGEAMAFNPDDGLFYHASGNSEIIFESVDFFAQSNTDIALSGDSFGEALALTYESPGNLLLTDLSSRFMRIGVNGAASFLGTSDHDSKGLAFRSVDTFRIQDNMTVQPFLGLKIEDADSPTLTLSVTVTLDDPAKGVLSALGNFSDDGGGMYSFSGTAEEATTAIQGLTFDPVEGRVAKGETESTVLTLEVDDGTAAPVSNTKTVVTTAVENSPVFTNAPITQAGSSSLYVSEIVAFDVNPADPLAITPTILPGWLNFVDNGDGTASLTGTPTSEDVGEHTVSLTVTNTVTGQSTTLVSTVTVIFINHRPNIRNNLNLYSVSRDDNLLRIIDPANGSTLYSVPINIPGETIDSVNGLAAHPFTGELWAVVELFSQSGRELLIINPTDGSTNRIGDTGDNFAGLAFDENGTLFGVTGDGGSPGEELYILDQTDATPTFFMDLGNGSSGETIGFNPDDGLMYHGSGSVFEIIDLDRKNIILISSSFSAHSALTYEGSDNFLLGVFSNFPRVSTSGVRIEIGVFDRAMKGLAFTAAAATMAIRGLTFVPAENRVGAGMTETGPPSSLSSWKMGPF